MSQTRQRPIKRQQPVKLRERREVVEAVVGVSVVVLGTALAVWLMRPGGLASRQAHATWLVLLGSAALIGWIWWAYHPATSFHVGSRKAVFYGVCAAILVSAGLAGIFWPGGFLNKNQPTLFDTPTITPGTTSSTIGGPTTTAPTGGASTTAPTGGASTTQAPETTSSSGG